MTNSPFSRRVIGLGLLFVLLFFSWLLWLQNTARAQSTTSNSQFPPPTVTGTPCPIPTQEWLQVEPVISPTTALTQTIAITLNNGDGYTVTTESGTFSSAVDSVPVQLFANFTHHLTVVGHVRPVVVGDCTYGNYMVSTTTDRFGAPLHIRQQFNGAHVYLPLVWRPAAGASALRP